MLLENLKFQLLVNKYKNVIAVKPLHYDTSKRDITRHFHIKFPYTNEYHAYVHNEKIISLTEVINVI